MERRFYLGIGLLAVFLAVGIWITVFMGNIHAPLARQLEQAAEEALTGDLQTGKNLMEQTRKSWEDKWKLTAAVADHSAMDEIDSLFAQTAAYARAEQPAAFAAYCSRLAELLRAMAEAHGLQWWNVL